MSDNMVVTIDPYEAALKIKGLDERLADEFLQVVQRVYRKRPTPAGIRELRNWLTSYPELWRGVFDLAETIETNFIHRVVSGEPARIALGKNISSKRTALGYDSAPVLDKLLIDNIVIAWLRNQWAEYQLVSVMDNADVRMSVVEFWERRLSASQHRYLLACQTLAKIRKLASKNPTLQVNIATQSGQQVNVAGDLVKND